MEQNRYQILNQRIEILKEHFVVEVIDGNITPQQEDLIRGFRLLCHAEIENFIEDLAINLLENSIEKWNFEKTANYNLAALFICSEKIEKTTDINEKANQLFSQYRKIIKDNHGIKEENIKKMFVPQGYSINHFDNILIGNMSSYGVLRGETAHSSASNLYHQLDFEDEKNKVEKIVEDLEDFMIKLSETP